MKNLAKGSVLPGLIALIGLLFYFQPKAEAVTIAIDSQENIKQEIVRKNKQENREVQDKSQQSDNQAASSVTEENNNNTINAANYSGGQSFRATAYCLKGRTASGAGVRRGIVAADTRILPLGTKINVSAGSYSGTYVVADTGGAVKGRILDIWVPNCSEAVRFGRRTVKVSVLGRKSK